MTLAGMIVMLKELEAKGLGDAPVVIGVDRRGGWRTLHYTEGLLLQSNVPVHTKELQVDTPSVVVEVV